MIEKNIVGVYSIRERYPIFSYSDDEEKRVDPVKYAPEKSHELDPTRGDISPHDNPWDNFSDFLQQEKREKPKKPKPPEHEETEEEAEAQAKVNANIAAQIQSKIKSIPAAEPSTPAPLPVPDKRQALAQLKAHLTPDSEDPLHIYETITTEKGEQQALGALTLDKVMARRVVCVFDNAPIRQVAKIFDQRHISGVPVIGLDKKLRGVISLTDLIHHLFQQGLHMQSQSPAMQAFLSQPVAEYMNPQVIHTAPDTLVRDACRQMLYYRIRRLIITEADEVRGIFSAQDAVRLLAGAELKVQTN